MYLNSDQETVSFSVEEPIAPPFAFPDDETLVCASGFWHYTRRIAMLPAPNIDRVNESDFDYRNTRRIEVLPSGDSFVSIQADGVSYMWSMENLDRQFDFPFPLSDAAFSQSGEQLLTTGRDGTVRIWNLKPTLAQRGPERHCGSGKARLARYVEDETSVIVDCGENLEVWPNQETTELNVVPLGNKRLVEMDRQGHLCLLRIDDTPTHGKLSMQMVLGECRNQDTWCALGTTVVPISADDLTKRDPFIATFSPNGSSLAIVGQDMVEVWSTDTFQKRGQFKHEDVVTAAFNATGSLLATGSLGRQPASRNTGVPRPGTVQVWD
ncbi:MAG: hypothetical protein U1E05_08955, partial [Patescibacteria group bacterium]|nr:hypothetical protein [Patescibacteria group bacterium]